MKDFLKEINSLIEMRLTDMSEKDRLELFNEEMKKDSPDQVLIKKLVDMGIGKTISMEKVLTKVETQKIKKASQKETKTIKEAYSNKINSLTSIHFNNSESLATLESIKEILKNNKEIKFNVNINLPSGLNLIHLAVERGDLELAELLIERGADLNSEGRGGNCSSPLNWINFSDESIKVKERISKELKK